MPVVTELAVHPVKSLHRVDLREAEVDPRGLAGDRRWMVVDESGTFLSQRGEPRLALVQPTPSDQGLLLAAVGMDPVFVLRPSGERTSVRVWNDTVDAVDAGDVAAAWLGEFLGRSVRLVWMPDDSFRPVDPDYALAGDHVSFADGYPILLASEDSLRDLNSRLEQPVPMSRFRANIVVQGAAPFEEDAWERLRIGSLEFRCARLCGRCLVTTTDQETGVRTGDEPLATLSGYRLIGKAAVFGRNLIPEGHGVVRVGDEVVVQGA